MARMFISVVVRVTRYGEKGSLKRSTVAFVNNGVPRSAHKRAAMIIDSRSYVRTRRTYGLLWP